MDINRMTYTVQSIIERAQSISVDMKLQSIEVEAVMKALFTIDESMARDVLERANIDVDALLAKYDEKLSKYNVVKGDNVQYGQYMSNGFTQVVNRAEKIMGEMKDEYISVEHMLMAAIETEPILKETVGNKNEVIREIINKVRGGNHVTTQNPEVQYEVLEKYGRDLVEEVRSGNVAVRVQ